MLDTQIRRRYFLHTVLHRFTERLFFAFGVLLIFAKTESVEAALIFALVGSIIGLVLKSAGLSLIASLFRRTGLMPTMTLGLFVKAATLLGIFFLKPDYELFLANLLLLSAMDAIGNTFYLIGAEALMLHVIGTSKSAGASTALIHILQTASGLLAAAAGILLSINGTFLYSLLVGAAIILMSTLPLLGVQVFKFPKVSFWQNIKKISLPMFLANVNPNHEFRMTILPLVMLQLSGSLETSIWINATIASISMVLAYFVGRLIDSRTTWIIWFALGICISSWIGFGLIKNPIGFLVPGILLGLAGEVLFIGRESRMGKELYSADNVFEGTLAVEFARTVGMFVGIAMFALAYLITSNLPQMLLTTGGLFLIPMAWYGAAGLRGKQE